MPKTRLLLLMMTTAALAFVVGAELDRPPVRLHALFNNAGVRGNITFEEDVDGNVTISVHLGASAPDAPPRSFAWGIYSFPVFFDSGSPCASAELGVTFHDLSKRHGSLMIPAPPEGPQRFVDSELRLRGPRTVWGRALLLRSTAYDVDVRACANIASEGETKTVEAVFSSPVAGTVIFRQGEHGETTIFANVFHTTEEYTPSSNHEWRILATDILDTASEARRGHRRCDYLQVLFDPNNVDDAECSKDVHHKCKIGDMSRKHGEFAVGATNSRYSKRFYVDTNLPLSAVEGQRTLYLVLYEKGNVFRILACSRLTPIAPKEVRAPFSADGVRGQVLLSQSHRTQPTVVTVQLKNLRGRGSTLHIYEFPVKARLDPQDDPCSDLGDLYNPFELQSTSVPAPGQGTGDQYPVGDLSGKFGLLDSSPLLNLHLGIHVDFNLPLFGPHSVVGRSIAVGRSDGGPWICATVGYPGRTVTAVATFVFPVAGRVVMRQAEGDPRADTTVFAELHYVDGSTNDTADHRWDVHEREPGRDFYNWTRRCESAGDHFNPFSVGSGRQYERHCNPDNPLRCAAGDFTGKHRRLTIAARPHSRTVKNKLFYTDVQLPLSGPDKVLGKGLVIHDDAAPPHRGDRLACTGIRIRHGLVASVRRWLSGPSVPSNVSGLVQFRQEFDFDPTEGKLELTGLERQASGFHVHQVWVPMDREFPCTADSVLANFNPFAVNVSLGPAPGVGSDDQYEVGDLSGKQGTLEGEDSKRSIFVDVNLPLHGPQSIIGRSVVVHKRSRNFRWTCGTLRADFEPGTSREVVALASFHYPGSAVEGYVRLRQLEHADGGRSDTWLEMDLRHAGKHNRNVTRQHAWAVFVNQVAHDAVEKSESSRCISAGYRWNPYNVRVDDELYKTECGPRNPYRCEMGDLSGRHGLLTIGTGRTVVTDLNLPLVGNFSVLGRSLVIFAKDGSPNKVACANIKPDIHLVRHVTVKKHPGFTTMRFMDHMRDLLEAKDWLVVQDTQTQREILDGQCVQITVHFYGPDAHRLQIEFSNLVNLGSVRRNTRLGLKVIETYYKPCRNLNDIDSASNQLTSTLVLVLASLLCCLLLRHRRA